MGDILNDKLLFTIPVFKKNIWGGNRLKKEFFSIEEDVEGVGEAWIVSAHDNGDCLIEGHDMTLGQLYREKRELFGSLEYDEFPLMVKLIDAKEDLSIQVHPDDEYVRNNNLGLFGKTECWLILDAKSDIVIGHNAKSLSQLKYLINNGKYKDLYRVVNVNKGDFFQIEPGCLHAIRGGTLLLEIQQNSDITFRVYDYDRKVNGVSRPLHIRESIECMKVPHKAFEYKKQVYNSDYYSFIKHISCELYTVFEYNINTENIDRAPCIYNENFMIVNIINGEGYVLDDADNIINIKKGSSFIVSAECKYIKIFGSIDAVITYPNAI